MRNSVAEGCRLGEFTVFWGISVHENNNCHDCMNPERICRALTVLWMPSNGMETEVVLIDEELGM